MSIDKEVSHLIHFNTEENIVGKITEFETYIIHIIE